MNAGSAAGLFGRVVGGGVAGGGALAVMTRQAKAQATDNDIGDHIGNGAGEPAPLSVTH